MGVIKLRTSQLDLGVRFSPHPAPDILNLRFCSCVDNRDTIHVLLLSYFVSNYHDFHQRDVDVLYLLLRI